MKYYVYENWLHNKAVIHVGACSFCNEGEGSHINSGDKYGQWLGPFKDLGTARLTAINTKRKTILKCSYCL